MRTPSQRFDVGMAILVAAVLVAALVIGNWWTSIAMVIVGGSIMMRFIDRRRRPDRYDAQGRLRRPS